MIPNENKLLALLSNNDVTFYIPPYQRNYEWDTEQCRTFLNDMEKTAKANADGSKSEHFFGSVTYFQTETAFGQPNKLILIDGQQRITTTMLFLIALRNVSEEESLKNFIDSKYLKNNSVEGDTEYKIKLKQVESDWRVYKNLVLSMELEEKDKSSAIYRNYNYFRMQLNRLKSDGQNLSTLVEKGLNKFSIITIELQPDKNEWENPQEIFESMNSLGKPLSLADLVRNYLLLGLSSDEQTELYHRYWMHIENVLPGQVSNFIRDYMQAYAKYAFPKATETNYKSLYRDFKDLFSERKSNEFLKDLSANADVYACIVLGNTTGNKHIDRQLEDIRTISITTTYSFLLALLKSRKEGNLSDTDTIAVLDAIIIFFLRRRIVGLNAPENKVMPTLVKKIPAILSAEDKKKETFNIFSSQENSFRLPNDIELSRSLCTMNFFNFKLCKFILAKVEETITRNRPDLNDELLTIEHIMPQKLDEKWEQDLGPDAQAVHQELVHTIGNLTLIRHNRELGQRPFNEKKDIYINKAGLQIAKTEITDKEQWGRAEIEARTDWIIDFISKEVLPIPDERRRINNFSAKESKGLSFIELQLVGLDIYFIKDPSIKVLVVGDTEVEFEGKKWRLSPLTKELYKRRGEDIPSGAYRGASHWAYDGIRLSDII